MNKRIYYKNQFIELSVNQHLNSKPLNEVLLNFVKGTASMEVYLDRHPEKSDLPEGFYFIEAAGGLIQRRDEFLFIRRHNRWDLPKGKLEKKELPDMAAIRECEEECGISGLSILAPLPFTWHLYEYKGSFALKKTWWYHMSTDFQGVLTPQLEEDITAVEWFKADYIKKHVLPDTYHTISDLITAHFNF